MKKVAIVSLSILEIKKLMLEEIKSLVRDHKQGGSVREGTDFGIPEW